MYWCKIANTEQEFTEIAKLNYETFVEEIPQHEKNNNGQLIDRFHDENTYLVVYKDDTLIGMLAFRDIRPFSLDEKIGDVTQYINTAQSKKICEIRLLGVKKAFRNGRVFLQLGKALYHYVYTRLYTAAFISGTTREEKFYKHLGFEQIAPIVGKEGAYYIPMVLTRDRCLQLAETLKITSSTFFPGPVTQTNSLQATNISHRSPLFLAMYRDLKNRLLDLSNAKNVAIAVGTGTLANDMMLHQIKADFPNAQGLILTNGAFGERLVKQAAALNLQYTTCSFEWGQPFDLQYIEQQLANSTFQWLLFVHGETSTGQLNDLKAIIGMASQYKVQVCVDCVSSFGSLPFSLQDVYLATAVSGKSIGALSGLSFVFTNAKQSVKAEAVYSQLASYLADEPPFTLPAYLVDNCLHAIAHYPDRFRLFDTRASEVLAPPLAPYILQVDQHYPTIFTLQFPFDFSDIAYLNGLILHDVSNYLRERKYVQISTCQPDFEQAFKNLCNLFKLTQLSLQKGSTV